jgi:hypothetical protein
MFSCLEGVIGAAFESMPLWTPVPPSAGETSMRISASIFLATVMLAAVAATPLRPAQAAWNLPWCANYYENNVTSCAFTSYAQCFATIAGPVGGHCTPNPTYYIERHRGKPRHDRYSGDR